MRGKIVGDGKKAKYFLDGKEVTKAAFYKAFPPRKEEGMDALIAWKPLICDALAVHPKQIPEAIEDAKKRGVPVTFNEDGCPIFESRSRYKEYCRAYGFYHKGGGYGDAMPGKKIYHEE